jgi:hypothetical protein
MTIHNAWSIDDVQLIPLSWLKAHEQIQIPNFECLLEATKKAKSIMKPVVVDCRTGAILDGHHRHAIGLELGLSLIPAICVDYLQDTEITVDVWPGNHGVEKLTKEDVIDMSLSPEVFPPKTSRHRIADELPSIQVPLELLLREEVELTKKDGKIEGEKLTSLITA